MNSLSYSRTPRRNRRPVPKSPLNKLISKKAYNSEDASTVATMESLGKREFPTSPSEESKQSRSSKCSFDLGNLSYAEKPLAKALYSYRSLKTSNVSMKRSICLKLPSFQSHVSHLMHRKVRSSFNNDIIPVLPFGKAAKKLKM